ncbi:hypothetical protein NDU88_001358 [Pleurodeles waltl]|uniref:Uncharacterized protein n=1 Tax=Pleurodeles waltl TaxID=8319 RepID=A0AAV7KSM4_PLEWA|nr:hypothetical protein NDU88_001358 [Pleurodeles waltl]
MCHWGTIHVWSGTKQLLMAIAKNYSNGHPIYMCNVPPLPPNTQKDKSSLINKVSHWVRHTRQCGSIIHSEILSADQFSSNSGCRDIIKFTLASTHLAEGLLSMEARNYPRKGTAIFLSDSWPVISTLGMNFLPAPKPMMSSEAIGRLAFNEETPSAAVLENPALAPEKLNSSDLDCLAITSDID